MREEAAKKLADELLKAVFENGQHCDVSFKYRGKDLHMIKMEVSIKITK